MSTVVSDPYVERSLIAERRAKGLDRWDEVWEGVYQIMPSPNNEHQDILENFVIVLKPLIEQLDGGRVQFTPNVSDRVDDWEQNYRIPDVGVFLHGSRAENHHTFWFGGPDLAIEIVSPSDRTREKIEFYESVSTRELLLVDREPWQLELHRLNSGALQPAGHSTIQESAVLTSEVVPLSWRLIEGDSRPRIEITHREDGRQWTV